MAEQDIAALVEAVVRRMTNTPAPENKSKNIDISLAEALALTEQVKTRAAQMGFTACVAIVDAAARPVAAQRMDGALLASYDIACDKAFTAAAMQMDTGTLGALAQPGGPLYGIGRTNGGRLVLFGGGVPLYRAGALCGGLGVSGGTAPQDTELAEYAAAVWRA